MLNGLDYGIKGDGITDDTVAFQNFLNALQEKNVTTEDIINSGYIPAGLKIKITSTLFINNPIKLEVNSMIECYNETGSAIVIGENPYDANRNTGYDLNFVGLRSAVGYTSLPTSESSGGNAIEIRSMQFSTLRVNKIIAFKGYGLYCNSSDGSNEAKRHTQQNYFYLGEVAYNGTGVKLLSNSAEYGGAQANIFYIKDVFSNFINIKLDREASEDSSEFINSTSNRFIVNAMDNHAPDGNGLEISSWHNYFEFNFVQSTILFKKSSKYNRIKVHNNVQTGVSLVENSGKRNILITGSPEDNYMPMLKTIQNDTTYQNDSGVNINLNLVYASTNDGNISLWIGETPNTLDVIYKKTTIQGDDTLNVCIPSFYYYKIVHDNNVNLAKAYIYESF